MADGDFGDVVCEAGDEVAVVNVIDLEVFDGFVLDGERERDAPIDEAAEEEVHVGAAVLDVADLLDEVLLGDFAGGVIDVLHVGVVDFQDAEADVQRFCGCGLVACAIEQVRFVSGRFFFGLLFCEDFIACTADAFLADFANGLVARLCGFRIFIALFWELDHDEFAMAAVFGIQLHNGMSYCRGTREEV